MKSGDFQRLLSGLRQRDEKAAEQLVRHYEPLIRRVVRMRFSDPRLWRVVDSLDICQSVLARFFADVRERDFQLDTPQQLRNLLVRMAVNKVIDRVRHEAHHQGSLPEGWEPAVSAESPSEVVGRQELADVIRARLRERERWLFDQRAQGRISRTTGTAFMKRLAFSRCALGLLSKTQHPPRLKDIRSPNDMLLEPSSC